MASENVQSDSQGDGGGGPGAILDFLFPGFGVFADTIHQQWGIDMGLYIHIVLGIGVLLYFWSQISDVAGGLAATLLLSTAEIRPDDEAYNVVMSWIATQPSASNSRWFFVNLDLSSRTVSPWSWDEEDDYPDSSGSRRDTAEKALAYTPSYGSHLLWFRGRPILFKRSRAEQTSSLVSTSKREEISLSCLGYSPSILKELMDLTLEQYMKRDHMKTIIYRGNMRLGGEPGWQRCMARKSRPFSTIYTRAGLKESIIEDMTDYLSPETKAWYGNCGIPWRRGYLFAGPPGTGKSSLSFALAGHFGLKIYTVSLNSAGVTEESLADLFSQLPQTCIVLFEDVDTAGLTYTRERQGGNDKQRRSSKKAGLSLSGLLNLLDGVASQEGRVLIMTTNHAKHLDKALIRPGRVDMTVQFALADEAMTGAIFRAVFAHLHASQHSGEEGAVGTNDENTTSKAEGTRSMVEKLAALFSERIPPGEFSPAEIQGYLIRHRREPKVALQGADDWVRATREEKAEESKSLEDQMVAGNREGRRGTLTDAESGETSGSEDGESGSDSEDEADDIM